jgi:hypothetical protein
MVTPQVKTTHLLRSAPYFPVADVQRSSLHYESVLGFSADYMSGSPPEFAIISRDGLAVMLRRVAVTERIRPNEAQGGTWDVFFWVQDARLLHAELRARGAPVVYGPVIQKEYGMLEFAVRDGDGHVLGFGEALALAGHNRQLP